MIRVIEQMIGLARNHEFDRRQGRALMEELEHRVLRVGADAAPGDRGAGAIQRRTVQRHPLAVRFHFELLKIGGEQPQPLDRKSVVSGKSVSVRVDLGGRRVITKKKTTRELLTHTNKSIHNMNIRSDSNNNT